jgi:nucleoside-diphosphate-sugar epimerase
MRIFVSGATGVIGRRAVPLMLEAGHQVTAAGREPERLAALEQQGSRAIVVDLFNPDDVARAVAGHDAVVNLATHIPNGTARALLPGAWRENDRIRRIAARLLVDAAKASGARRFVQESFAPIYPDSGDHWINEEATPRPARYNRSALDAEAAAQRFTNSQREGVALRFGLLYGPRDRFTEDVLKLVRLGWLPILGKPEGFLSMLNHEDAASAVLAALDVPAGIYNVVDDEPLTRGQFADTLAALLGVLPPKIPPPWLSKVTGSVGEVIARSLRISNRKLRAASAWAPRYPNARTGWRAALASFEQRPLPKRAA